MRFTVLAPRDLDVVNCNCSICSATGYTHRSNPDGIDVNARCLDQGTVGKLRIRPFDGQNWEDNAASLAHLSRKE